MDRCAQEKCYFGTVIFGAKEWARQQHFLHAMCHTGIIHLSIEEVDSCVKSLQKANYNQDIHNRFVLHGEKEKKKFELMMKTFFGDRPYTLEEEASEKDA